MSTLQARQESVDHLVGLFPEIRPVSECVTHTEITEGFTPCPSGQRYLHSVVPHLQRFLFFSFRSVYLRVKESKSSSLRELLFTQVCDV